LGLEDFLVLVDDVALPAGVIRLRAAGSAGGHNGLRDIELALGNLAAVSGKSGQEYQRLRIGVDAPGVVPQKDYVLGAFSAEQKPKIEVALKLAVEAMGVWAANGITTAMNKFNGGEKG
jgi:peptidyl-tRNA hydrolase, PTH1 family